MIESMRTRVEQVVARMSLRSKEDKISLERWRQLCRQDSQLHQSLLSWKQNIRLKRSLSCLVRNQEARVKFPRSSSYAVGPGNTTVKECSFMKHDQRSEEVAYCLQSLVYSLESRLRPAADIWHLLFPPLQSSTYPDITSHCTGTTQLSTIGHNLVNIHLQLVGLYSSSYLHQERINS